MRRLAIILGALVACGPGKSTTKPTPAPLESFFPLADASDAVLCRTLAAPVAPTGGDATSRRKVIISDLHLGPGTDQGRQFAGLEDFFATAELTAFLERLTKRPTELIIAGDFIEFWQIQEALGLLPKREGDGPVLGTDQAGSLAALDVVLLAHADVFRALAAFLATGDNRLVIVVGNHDGDLAWPRVQLAIARALGVADLSRLTFANREYADRGVVVAHGHQLDPANKAGAPFVMDGARCRLAASWGQVFVAKFLGSLEQRFPFVDNLVPESAALMWGVGEEPDVTEPLIAAYRFVDMLISEQSGALNLEALRAAALAFLGAPDSETGASEGWATVWERMPSSDTFFSALSLLAKDKQFAPLRDKLVAAALALPDTDAALAVLAEIDLGLLGSLKDRITTDPLEVAAAERLARDPSASIIVFGHTHVFGGSVKAIEGGHYANSGTWTPIGKIAELRKKNVKWPQLDLSNQQQFPRRLPAIVVDYEGDIPRPPHIVDAR